MLKTLRAKPYHVKKSIAVTIATGLSLVVFAVWLSTFAGRQNAEKTHTQTLSPLLGVSVVFQNSFSNIKKSFSDFLPTAENLGVVSGEKAETMEQSAAVVNASSDFDISGIVILGAATTTASTTNRGL